jgi:hypothetical protein
MGSVRHPSIDNDLESHLKLVQNQSGSETIKDIQSKNRPLLLSEMGTKVFY